MSLAWMGAFAAVVTIEKVTPHAEPAARVLGALLAGLGVALLAAPGLVTAAT